MCRPRPETRFPNNHIVIFFEHLAVFKDGNKVLSTADFAVHSRPQLCPAKYRFDSRRVDGLSVCDMNVHHLEWFKFSIG